MVMIIKTAAILLLELAIYYVIGTAVTEKLKKRITRNIAFQTVIGFIVYQILFQVCAIPFIWMKQSLTELAYVWAALIIVVTLAAGYRERHQIAEDFCRMKTIIRSHKLLCGITVLILLAVCWYSSLNGELNDDSLYYIGVVNTTLTTDTMFQYNAYTGIAMPSHYFRRVLVTFEINAAVLCKLSGVHPIVLMRIFRGNLNVILTALTIGLLGTVIFRKERTLEKSAELVCVSMILYFIADRTMYSNAAFFLTRTYEGKAYAGNVLIYLMIYLCLAFIQTGEKWYLILAGIVIWGCSAISSSAVMVGTAGVATMLITWLICRISDMKGEKNGQKDVGKLNEEI